MPEDPKDAFEVISKMAKQIHYGEWKVKLIIHNGEVTGFDQIDAPVIRYRVFKQREK